MRRGRDVAALALLALACGPSDAPQTSADLPVWEVDADEVRIGSVDDPYYALTWVRGIEVADDGSIYSLHSQEQLVRHFDADGTLLGTFGGEGDGPGEFQSPFTMGMLGDSVWVLDGRGYRFNLFTADGTFARSFSVPFGMVEGRTERQPPRAVGLLDDGTIHGAEPAFSHLVEEGIITHHRPYFLDADGEATDTLPAIPMGRSTWAIYDPDNRDAWAMYRRQPFADGPLWGFGHGDRSLVIVDREVPPEGVAPTVRVTRLGFDGDTLFSTTLPYDPVPIDLTSIDSIVANAVPERAVSRGTPAQLNEWARRTLYVPAHHPGVTKWSLADDGSIWLAGVADEAGMTPWTVLDEDGTPIGWLELRDSFRPMAIADRTIWGTESDELDISYIVGIRYRTDSAPDA